MKTISILHNGAIEKVTDFMDRIPGLFSLTVTLIIVIGFVG